MSHYAVNTGVPKTLIQHLIRWVVSTSQLSNGHSDGAVDDILMEIVEQEITPELIPTKDGELPQSTEASIGPYPLQDFNLYYVLRHGFRPSKIAFLARHAWSDPALGSWPEGYPDERRIGYDLATIKSWLGVFVTRFFGFSQFKRSALPNGPKVSSGGSLSPRGDWRMPSDANARIWLADLEKVPDGPVTRT
jgi:NAD+ synthase (glutamine-hydrolysing)